MAPDIGGAGALIATTFVQRLGTWLKGVPAGVPSGNHAVPKVVWFVVRALRP
jgi:hypothetical protein